MSLPREVLPPDPATNNAFIYCLAEAAHWHGIKVLFTAAQSNHHHTAIYDPLGNDPAFIEHFHKLFALTNPVKDGLVERADHWPGVTSLDAFVMANASLAVAPFREDGPMPDTVELGFVRPAGFEHLTAAEFLELVLERVKSIEDLARARRLQTGIRVLGRRGVLQQDWRDRPTSRASRRGLSPRVAARNKAFAASYSLQAPDSGTSRK